MKIHKTLKNQFSLPLKVSLALSLTLSACNFSKVNRVDHEGAAAEVSKSSEAETKSEIRSLKATDLSGVYKRTLNIKTAADALSIIKDLEAQVLKPEVIGNPSLNMEDTVTAGLSYYTTATLKLLTLAPESEDAKAQSEKFITLVSTGCNANLDNCTRILWIKKDPRTHLVLSKIAKNQDSQLDTSCKDGNCTQGLESLFRTISLSFATSNQVKDVELYQVFVKRIHQYAAVLEKNKDPEGLKRQGVIFDSILANLSAEEDEKIILPIVKALPPWTYSRKNSQNFNFGTEKIFLVASKNLLYENGALNSGLKKILLEEQKNTANKDSVYWRAKTLTQEANTKNIFKALNFDPSPFLSDSFYDEYFFIISRLMESHLNYDEAEAVWKGSKKNIETINKKIRDIARLELINLVVKTNQYFSVLLQTKDLPSTRLFIKSIDESRPLTDTWAQYFSKLSKVSNLLGQIATNNQLSATEQKTVETTKNFIIGTKRNAKFLSVYPNMLNLGYFMIKLDAMLTTTTWWGATISINPKTIVDYLLDGGFATPWYLFSGDTNPINKSEMILAFDYALRLGSFEIFGQAKDDKGKPKIDRLQFFKALKSTMDSNIKDLNDTIDKMEKLESDSDVKKVLNFCSTKNFQGADVKIKLDDFEQYALLGTSAKGMIGNATKLYESSSAYYNVPASTSSVRYMSMRNNINSRFLQLRAMSLPLLENIKSLDIPEADKKTLEDKVNEEIKDVTKKLNTYYALALNNHALIKDCTQALVRTERTRQFYLINSEKKYLEAVYDNMLNIFNEKDPAKKLELAKKITDDLNHKLFLANADKKYLDTYNEIMQNISTEKDVIKKQTLVTAAITKLGFNTADALLGSNYVYSKYQLFKRFEKYSQSPELALKVFAEDLDDSSMNTLVVDTKDVQFLNLQTGQPLDKNTFVRIGLSRFNTQGSNTIQWFRSSTYMKIAQMKIESMIAIYKLGYDLGLQATPVKYKERKLNPITSQEIVQEGIDMARSLSISPEEEATLRAIGQYELYPNSDLQDYLFDISETKFNGVIDNIFLMATRVQEDLDEATRYYQERTNTKREDAMIFPMDSNIEQAIHKIYQRLIKKDEILIADFTKGLRQAQKQIDQNPIQIVYRLLEGTNAKKVYTPDLIAGGQSVLVDENKIKSMQDNLHDFHSRLTYKVYQTPPAAGSSENNTDQGDQ